MRIEINNDSVCLGNDRVINMQEFTKRYKNFVEYRTGKDTAEIEEEGKSLLKGDLGDADRINAFVSRVIIWGEENRGIIHGMVYPPEKKVRIRLRMKPMLQKLLQNQRILCGTVI